MALTPQTVQKICKLVGKDADCQEIIRDDFDSSLLEFFGLAGSARNLLLLADEITPPLATRTIRDMFLRPRKDLSRLLCTGIALATQKVILHNRKQLPEVAACSMTSRVHLGVHHAATWVRMKGDTEYVFDWHATLNIYNPILSQAADWPQALNEVPAASFRGFK